MGPVLTPFQRPFRLGLACAALAAAVASGSAARPADAESDAPRGPRLGIWCEFMPYPEVFGTLPLLARYRCELLLHVERRDIGDPVLAALYREARRQGVRVIAWPLLPYDEHLYLGEESLGPMRELTRRFLDWSREAGFPVDGVVMDCEPSPLLGRRMARGIQRLDLPALARLFRGTKDPAAFTNGVAAIRRFIGELHGHGLPVYGAANRVLLDCARYGNVAMQDSLNAPFTMLPWDRTSFITYRYKASHADYVAMINRYASIARRHFGERAALDMGLTGSHQVIPGHRDRAQRFGASGFFLSFLAGIESPDELRTAIGVALSRGVTHINLFSLDGAAASPLGLEAWLEAAASARSVRGLARWSPCGSAKIATLQFLLEAVYRVAVGRGGYPPDGAPAAVAQAAAGGLPAAATSP
jgi:hypothetical protein